MKPFYWRKTIPVILISFSYDSVGNYKAGDIVTAKVDYIKGNTLVGTAL